jgi:hypothetical protein
VIRGSQSYGLIAAMIWDTFHAVLLLNVRNYRRAPFGQKLIGSCWVMFVVAKPPRDRRPKGSGRALPKKNKDHDSFWLL